MEKQKTILLETNRPINKILQIAFSARAKDSTRYALESVLCEKTEKEISFVSCDGRREHKITFNENNPAFGRIYDTMENGLWEITAMNKAQIVFTQSDGNFPKYQDIIPQIKSYFVFTGYENSAQIVSYNLALKGIAIKFEYLKAIEEILTDCKIGIVESGWPILVEKSEIGLAWQIVIMPIDIKAETWEEIQQAAEIPAAETTQQETIPAAEIPAA